MSTEVRERGGQPPSAPERGSPAYRAELARLAAAARTVPGRLRSAGALLVLLVLVFGALTVWQVSGRATASADVVNHSAPLSDDAAQLYRSLADADTTAATGFLQAGQETAAVRTRYNDDIRTASALLAQAAARTSANDPGQAQIQALNTQLPVYTGLVEEAGADNRQGLPLGGAYLRYASGQMQNTMLPEAQKLYAAETASLHRDYAGARSLPWAAVVLGVLALAALTRVQIGLFRRTNRVFNVGLAAASGAVLVALLWLVVGQSVASADLADSDTHGAAPLQVLNQARITALQCRGAENLDLVARGSTTAYETAWDTVSAELAGSHGYLAQARQLTSGDPAAQTPVRAALADFTTWQQRHDTAKTANQAGDYDTAVADTIGSGGAAGGSTTDAAFEQLDAHLTAAIAQERAHFASAAGSGRDAVAGLAVGAAVLAVLAAGAAVLGVGRRLAEYR